MRSIGIFFGSTEGNTARAAELIAHAFRSRFGPDKQDESSGDSGGDSAGGPLVEPAESPPRFEHDTLLEIEVLDIAEFYVEDMTEFDCLVVGVPTWNHGQLQADWEAALHEFDTLDLSGKRAALFGLGDQRGYPDTFGDALFFLADHLRRSGAALVGAWPCDGYDFNRSWAVEDGRFLGLLLDETNQPELTGPRIERWIEILGVEFGLTSVSTST